MLTISEIPLLPAQAQSFTIPLNGTLFVMSLQWRETGTACWLLTLADASSIILVASVPLLTGANLLGQYPDIPFPGELWVATDGNPDATPTFNNLGVDSHLYFGVRS